MTALGPDVARRRLVLLTGLRWLRMGPIAAMLVVLLQDRGLTLALVAGYGDRLLATPFHVEPLDIAVWATLGPDTDQPPEPPDVPIGRPATVPAP